MILLPITLSLSLTLPFSYALIAHTSAIVKMKWYYFFCNYIPLFRGALTFFITAVTRSTPIYPILWWVDIYITKFW